MIQTRWRNRSYSTIRFGELLRPDHMALAHLHCRISAITGLSVSRRLLVLVLLPVFLLIGACGGSSSKSSTTAPTATTTAPGTGGGTATQTTSTPGGSTRGQRSQTISPNNGRNVRVPATYTITTDGKVTPPVISVPAFLAVKVT